MATTATDLTKEIQKTATTAVDTARTTAQQVQRDLTDAAGDARDAVQKVFLAGLGALALARDEGTDAFRSLVERGETVELPGLGAERVKAVRARLVAQTDRVEDEVEGRVNDAKFLASETVDQAEGRVQDAVATVMKRLGVPTRNEVTELTASVERLTARVEALKAERKDPAVVKVDDVEAHAVGGGWYEVRVGGVVLEKVQGKEDAEAAVLRIRERQTA